jgi:hypothetical protein
MTIGERQLGRKRTGVLYSHEKRDRAAALQDAGAFSCEPLRPRGFGVRQPYAALPSSFKWDAKNTHTNRFGCSISALIAFLLVLTISGCVTKSKAKAEAQAAFMAGQQQAMIRMSQPHQSVVTFIGPVRNPTVPWTQDLTLAKAIIATGYTAQGDPRQIMIVRNGQAIPVDPKKLLEGEDIPLVAGDLVQIGQ